MDITGDVEDELGLRLRRRMARDQDYDLLVGEEAVKPDANESQGIVMDEHQAASQCHGRAQGSSAVDIMGRRCCEESGEKVFSEEDREIVVKVLQKRAARKQGCNSTSQKYHCEKPLKKLR